MASNLLVDWLNKNRGGAAQLANKLAPSASKVMGRLDAVNNATKPVTNITPNPQTATVTGISKTVAPVNTGISSTNSTIKNSINTPVANRLSSIANNNSVSMGNNQSVNTSRFIGFQNTNNLLPKTDLAGNIINTGIKKESKPSLEIPTYESKINTQVNNANSEYKKNQDLIKQLHYDLKNNNYNIMSIDEITTNYPQWAGQENIVQMLQSDILPFVKNNQFADLKEVEKIYPELMPENQAKGLIKEQIKSRNRSDNFKSLVDKTDKLSNSKILSDSGKKYVDDLSQLSELISSVRDNYSLKGNPTDLDILSYAYENLPEVKAVVDDMKNQQLTDVDKATIFNSKGNMLAYIMSMGQNALDTATNWYQNTISNPLNESIENGTLSRKIQQLGINAGAANQISELAGVVPNMAGNLLGGVNKGVTANARIFGGQDIKGNIKDTASAIAVDAIKGGGGAMSAIFNTVYALPTAIFEIANTTDLGGQITEATLGNLQTALTDFLDGTIAENIGLSKDTPMAAWFNSLDEETKSDLVNEATVVAAHNLGKVGKEAKLRADVAIDAITNAIQRGKGGALFQAWVEKGLAGEGNVATKGAVNRVLGEGYSDFKTALKENFARYDEVLKARQGITPEAQPMDNNNLPGNRTTGQKVGSVVNNTANKVVDTTRDVVNKGVDAGKRAVNSVADRVSNFDIKDVARKTGEAVKAVEDTVKGAKDKISETNASIKSGIENAKNAVKENVIDPFNEGKGKTTSAPSQKGGQIDQQGQSEQLSGEITSQNGGDINLSNDNQKIVESNRKGGNMNEKAWELVNGIDDATMSRMKSNPYSAQENTNLIENIEDNPSFDFNEHQINRYQDVLDTIVDKLEQKENTRKNDIGPLYQRLEEANTPINTNNIKSQSQTFRNTLSENDGIISSSEQTKINKLLDAIDNLGEGNTSNIRNIRKMADKRSKRDTESTTDGIRLIREIRDSIDNEIRTQVPEMKEVDFEYRKIKDEISDLRGNLINKKSGKLRDNAVSTVKNLLNANNKQFLDRLEKEIPGITKQLQAIRDSKFVYNAYQTGNGSRFISGIARGTLGNMGKAVGVMTGGLGGLLFGYLFDKAVDKAIVNITRKALKETVTKMSPEAKEEYIKIMEKVGAGKELSAKEKDKLRDIENRIAENADKAKKTKAEQEARDKFFEDIKNSKALPNGIKLNKVTEIDRRPAKPESKPKNAVTAKKTNVTEKKVETKKAEVKTEEKKLETKVEEKKQDRKDIKEKIKDATGDTFKQEYKELSNGKLLYRGESYGSNSQAFWTDDKDIADSFGNTSTSEKYIIMTTPLDVRLPAVKKILKEEISGINIDSATSAYKPNIKEKEKLIEWAKNNGYDGIIGETSDLGMTYIGNEYIIFGEGNIKNAVTKKSKVTEKPAENKPEEKKQENKPVEAKNSVTSKPKESKPTQAEKKFSYKEYGELTDKITKAKKEISDRLDKQYEQERSEKLKRFEELRDKKDKTDAEGKELVKLADELNNMSNKYERLKDKEFAEKHPDLLAQKEEMQNMFDNEWKVTYKQAVENLNNAPVEKATSKAVQDENRAKALKVPNGTLIYTNSEYKYIPSLKNGLIRLTKEEGEAKLKEQLKSALEHGFSFTIYNDPETLETFVYNSARTEELDKWNNKPLDEEVNEIAMNEDNIEEIYPDKGGNLTVVLKDEFAKDEGIERIYDIDINEFLTYSNLSRYVPSEANKSQITTSKNKITAKQESALPEDVYFEDVDPQTLKILKDKGDEMAIKLYEEMGIKDEMLEDLFNEINAEQRYEEGLNNNETLQDIDYQQIAELENETPQIAEGEMNAVTKKVPEKAKDLVTNKSEFETLPSDISVLSESKKMGQKRIAPDRVSRQQLTYDEGVKQVTDQVNKFAEFIKTREDLYDDMYGKYNGTLSYEELKSNYDKSRKDYQDIAFNKRGYKSNKSKEFVDLWREISNAKDDSSRLSEIGKQYYINRVKKDISKGYQYPQEVLDKIPGAKKAVTSRERYQKGLDTSFSSKDERIDYSQKDKIGGGIKSQDGKIVTKQQVDNITKGVVDFQKVFGINMKKIAEDMGIVYVDLHGGNAFLSKYAGLFRRTTNADGTLDNVSVSVGGSEVVRYKDKKTGERVNEKVNTTMSHELGHAVDYLVDGKLLSGYEYWDIYSKYKKPMLNGNRVDSNSGWAKYLAKQTEVTARAFGQYMDMAKGGNIYDGKEGYWTKEDFENIVKPILEKAIKNKLGDWHIDPDSIKYQKITNNGKNKITSQISENKSESLISLKEQKALSEQLKKTGLAKNVEFVDSLKDLLTNPKMIRMQLAQESDYEVQDLDRIEKMEDNILSEYGTTDNPARVAFVDNRGRWINGNMGGYGNYRDVDHREIASIAFADTDIEFNTGTDGLVALQAQTGLVRVDYNQGYMNIDTVYNLMPSQKEGLMRFADENIEEVNVDITDPRTGITLESGTFSNIRDAIRYIDNHFSARLQSVWHGSPNDFDRFDSSHMGEGEGAQAHGWGHYVAVDKTTGEHYANMGKANAIHYKGKNVESYFGKNIQPDEKIASSISIKMENGWDFKKAYESTKEDIKYSLKEFEQMDKDNSWSRKGYSVQGGKDLLKSFREMDAVIDSIKESDFKSESNRNLYEVEIPDQRKADTPTGSNYIEEGKNLTEKQWNKFRDAVLEIDDSKKLEIDPGHILKTIDGYYPGQSTTYRLYKQLSEVLKGDKQASEFLNSLGYDGIHYFGGIDGEAYVLFNDDALDITNHIKYLRDTKGDIVGATLSDGTVLIDKNIARADTLPHEFSHLLRSYAKENSPELFSAINKIANDAPQALKDYVRDTYGELSEDAFLDEVFAWRQGKHSAVKGAETWYQRMWNAIKEVWNRIKSKFGKKYADLSVFDAWEKMSSEELMNKIDGVLKGGKEIGKGKGGNSFEISKNAVDSQGKKLTPEQQMYFADSKVRDSKGDLLRVYHGTHGEFTVFDWDKIGSKTNNEGLFGKGFYATSMKSYSEYYSGKGWHPNRKTGKEMEGYLNIKKPFMWNDYKGEDVIKNLRKELGLSKDVLYLNKSDSGIHILTKVEQSQKFTEALKKAGYDGVWFKYDNKSGQDEIVFFDSRQFKNLDNQNPTSNEDIRYQATTNPMNRVTSTNKKVYNLLEENGKRIGNALSNGKNKVTSNAEAIWNPVIRGTEAKEYTDDYGNKVSKRVIVMTYGYKGWIKKLEKAEKNNDFEAQYEIYDKVNGLGHAIYDETNKTVNQYLNNAYDRENAFAMKEIIRRGPQIIKWDSKTVDKRGKEKKAGFYIVKPNGDVGFHVKYNVGNFARKQAKILKRGS